MQKLVITIERTASQVSIYSLEPTVLVTRDATVNDRVTTDQEMLALFGAALEALRDSQSIPA